MTLKNGCKTTATTCAADAHKYISKILCKPQRAQHTPKCSTTRALDFCNNVVCVSNNTFATHIANISMQRIDFFLHCTKFVVNQTMFGNKIICVVRCLIAVKQQYLKIRIALFAQSRRCKLLTASHSFFSNMQLSS